MRFKSKLFAVALAAASFGALADPTLSVFGGTATTKVGFENINTTGFASEISNLGTQYDVGATLSTLTLADITFEFVGKEAGYTNKLFVFGNAAFTNKVSLGTKLTFNAISASNPLNFGFQSNSTGSVFNNPSLRIAFMTNSSDTQVLALFNDAYGDKDYDDMGVKITVTAVPEPETYAMMLAGLGLMGAIARRRKAKQTA